MPPGPILHIPIKFSSAHRALMRSALQHDGEGYGARAHADQSESGGDGSKADIRRRLSDVRFTPKSKHSTAATGMSALCQKRTYCAAKKNVVIRSPRRRGRAAAAG